MVDIGRSEVVLPNNEVAEFTFEVLYFRCFRKESRKQHRAHHAGTENAATSEVICISTGLISPCASVSIVTVGRQSILMVCDEVSTREKHSGR